MMKRDKQSNKRMIGAVEGLYEIFDTKEGQKDVFYRTAAARDRTANDMGQMSTIKKDEGTMGTILNMANE